MENITINKCDILEYAYYDENHNYIVKLNRNKLRELFKADEIILEEKPIEICKRALKQNIDSQYDTIIFDTAGRLSIDEVMMNELKEIKAFLNPDEIIFVADSLTGQDAVNTAKEFNDKIGINSIVLTRLDGDGRGGAALSMRVITNCPIRYIGLGEKINDIDVFHTKRIVSRILDKGDIVSLVEKTEEIMNKIIELAK